MDKLTFAKKIDSTLLRPTATEAEIRRSADWREYKFAIAALPSQFMELRLSSWRGAASALMQR